MNIDYVIFLFLNSFAGSFFYLDFIFYFFASLLPYLFLFFTAFWALRNFKKNGLFSLEVIFAGFFSRYALVEIVRYLFPRIRPFDVLENVNLLLPYKDTPSFPSGHTAFLFAISTVVYLYNKKLGIALYVLSFLGGISRIFMGMHFPTDIFIGALTGILGGLIVWGVGVFLKSRFHR